MNPKRLIPFVFVMLVALLLSACNINIITEIKSDGSGAYTQEVGLPTEDLAGFGMTADEFCDEMAADMPDGMSLRKETRNEKETWCIFESKFASLDELKNLYEETDTHINQIVVAGDELIYDIKLDMSGDGGLPGMGLNANWVVKMPGRVIETNATEQNGNTLTWKLQIGKENNLRAVSKIDGLGIDFGDGWFGYLLGGGLFLCLCCFIPLVIAGVAFFLIRKKKAAAPTAPAPDATA